MDLASKEYLLKNRQEAVGRYCIYFLIKGDEIVYVGQCRYGLSRIADHFYDEGKDFDSFAITSCSREELSDLEANYIIKFQPKLNINMPPNKRYKRLSQIKEELFIDSELFDKVVSVHSPEPIYKNYYDINTVESLFWLPMPPLERALHIELERYRIHGRHRTENSLKRRKSIINIKSKPKTKMNEDNLVVAQ